AALDDHEELRARRSLAGQDEARRDIDLLGQLADLLDVMSREVLEQRDVLQQLELLVDLCHLSLIDGVDGPATSAQHNASVGAQRLRRAAASPAGPRLHLASARSARSPTRTTPMPDSAQPAPGSDPAKRHSAALTDGPDRAGARAMLKAIGFTDE